MPSRNRLLHKLLCLLAAIVVFGLLPTPARAQVFAGRPKLIVIVVIDQLMIQPMVIKTPARSSLDNHPMLVILR